jgi:hypothetical protein
MARAGSCRSLEICRTKTICSAQQGVCTDRKSGPATNQRACDVFCETKPTRVQTQAVDDLMSCLSVGCRLGNLKLVCGKAASGLTCTRSNLKRAERSHRARNGGRMHPVRRELAAMGSGKRSHDYAGRIGSTGPISSRDMRVEEVAMSLIEAPNEATLMRVVRVGLMASSFSSSTR